MAKVQDGGLVVSEFELQSHRYVYFRTNALRKGIKHLNFDPGDNCYKYKYLLDEGVSKLVLLGWDGR